MSRAAAVLQWLEDKSDWLSPIVVKEVRQVVRTREFIYSFGASLVAGLAVAFFGAVDAIRGNGTSGSWTFTALTGCLAFLGLAVVPLGAFNALRNERLEQTLELITLTALSARRIVIGKLFAQGVKLLTYFAAVAPFIAMSFLLGGVDFLTILVTLAVLFLWSLWVSALCLFLSTLLKSRAMSGLVFGGLGIVMFMILSFVASGPIRYGFGFSAPGSEAWWVLGISTSFCLMSMANLVLLAESRLALPTDNDVLALRVGFLVQFLLILAWALPFIDEVPRTRANTVGVLGVVGGLHLAIVALFTTTEDFVLTRLARRHLLGASRSHWLLALFRPGGGRGAAYVLAQMVLLVGVASLFKPDGEQWRWLLAICGYICLFSGVPTAAFRLFRPASVAAFKLRIALLLTVPASLILPDLIHYLVWQPESIDFRFGARHLLNPFRALANWRLVEARSWLSLPLAFGLTGLLAYALLIQRGWTMSMDRASADPDGTSAEAGERASAHVVY